MGQRESTGPGRAAWVVSVVAAGGLVAAAVYAGVEGLPDACKRVVVAPEAARDTVTTTCTDASITSPILVLIGLALVALLIPTLSEFEILGVFSAKRIAREAQVEAEGAKSEVARLKQRIDVATASSASGNALNVYGFPGLGSDDDVVKYFKSLSDSDDLDPGEQGVGRRDLVARSLATGIRHEGFDWDGGDLWVIPWVLNKYSGTLEPAYAPRDLADDDVLEAMAESLGEVGAAVRYNDHSDYGYFMVGVDIGNGPGVLSVLVHPRADSPLTHDDHTALAESLLAAAGALGPLLVLMRASA